MNMYIFSFHYYCFCSANINRLPVSFSSMQNLMYSWRSIIPIQPLYLFYLSPFHLCLRVGWSDFCIILFYFIFLQHFFYSTGKDTTHYTQELQSWWWWWWCWCMQQSKQIPYCICIITTSSQSPPQRDQSKGYIHTLINTVLQT